MKDKLSKSMFKLSQTIIKLRYWILALVILLTAFFGYYATKIQIDSDLLNSLPDSDPVAKLYNEIGDKYSGNRTAIIILETDNVFNTKVLEDVKQITDTLVNMEGVNSVTSLTNIIDIRSSEWGIEIGKLVDEYDLPDTPQELDSLKQRIFSKDMYHGVIVSDDSTATAIMASISQDADQQEVARQIRQKVEQMNIGEKVYFTGLPFLLNDTSKIILDDLLKLIPITALIIMLILFLGFRSWRGVLLPLITVGIAIVWTLGLITLTGHKLTIISDVIPVVLLALGSAYTIHVLNRINETKAENPRKALILALAYIIVPVFLAYITTAFGFVSFVFGAYLTSIREFGVFTAIGITFAFLLSVTFVPALIDVLGLHRKKSYTPGEARLVKNFLSPLGDKVMAHPKRVVWLWVIMTLVFATGIGEKERKVDMASYYKEGSPTRVAQDLVDQKFGGASPVYVVFDGDVQDPEFLRLMKQTEDYMKSASPYVSYTFSVADLVEQMNDAMGEGKKIPDDRAKIEQLWFLIEGEDVMSQLVSPDLDEAVIQARFATLDTKIGNDFSVMMQKYAKEHSTDKIKIRVTGLPNVYRQLDISLLRSQATSLALAIVLMLIIVSLTMWSLRCGYISLIPLVLTIIFSFGFMGWAHIPLDMATVLVASVTLGVGIDYAVHIISHYRTYMDEYGDIRKALHETIRVSGNAILINVFAVALGFLTLLFSALSPVKNFGLMMALTMFVSGFAAITLLPAVIVLLNGNRKKDK